MKVFLDTNILIDFIARREDFYQAAANKKHFPQDAIHVLDAIEFFDYYWSGE